MNPTLVVCFQDLQKRLEEDHDGYTQSVVTKTVLFLIPPQTTTTVSPDTPGLKCDVVNDTVRTG